MRYKCRIAHLDLGGPSGAKDEITARCLAAMPEWRTVERQNLAVIYAAPWQSR